MSIVYLIATLFFILTMLIIYYLADIKRLEEEDRGRFKGGRIIGLLFDIM